MPGRLCAWLWRHISWPRWSWASCTSAWCIRRRCWPWRRLCSCGPGGSGGFPGGCGAPAGPCWGRDWPWLAAVLVMMAVQAGNRPGPEDCTVVVLGCQVSASGEPTVMLRDRIDAAYDYLTAHPESRCVASGGQNDNEPISEAACIRNTLAARGIDPDRILLEDRSRSTEENLRFTAEIIRQQGLNPRVAIASDNFHQLRASVWARRCGLEAESLAAPAGGPWVRAIGPGRPWPWWCWRLGVCCRGRSAGADKSRPPQRLGDKRITASPGRTTCPPVFWHFYGNKASVMT